MSHSLRAYARHRKALGLPGGTEGAVRRAIKEGILTSKSVTRAGKIRSFELADLEWAAATKSEMVPLTGPTASAASAASLPPAAAPPSDLARARAAREATNAEIAALDLAERRGQLVDAREVETRWATVIHHCRTKLLGITARAAQRDPTLTSEQLALFDGLLREALEELADKGAPR